ncbi:MAG: M28 family peptidase [Steroidobacteraceae bacterium]
MYRRHVLPLCLLLAALIAGYASLPPAPLPATAPPGVFSTGRALADIAVLARAPHPVGSAAHAAAAEHVLARMRALGLEVREQAALERGYPVRNLIGVLPGRDRGLPALALMAHYDSVPGSPGAADDSTGVAVALEVARALRAGPPPLRDVALVITDGEARPARGAPSTSRTRWRTPAGPQHGGAAAADAQVHVRDQRRQRAADRRLPARHAAPEQQLAGGIRLPPHAQRHGLHRGPRHGGNRA